MLIINGVKKDIDFTDADLLERIEIASKKVYDDTEKIKQQIGKNSLAEGIRQECKILKDFLDYVFGEGTSQEWFEGKDSLNLLLNAFKDKIEKKEKQINVIDDLVSKYSPERVQR